jgi:hypothetical protein
MRDESCGRDAFVLQLAPNVLPEIIMRDTLTARIPPRVEQKLTDYCVQHGVTRTDAVVRALDDYLDRQSGGSDAYALAADLIPKRGVAKLQSAAVRQLARDAFRGSRAR